MVPNGPKWKNSERGGGAVGICFKEEREEVHVSPLATLISHPFSWTRALNICLSTFEVLIR